MILAGLQGIVLLVLILTKPYFNTAEKVRSIFTFNILVFSNFITMDMGNGFTLPLVLIAACFVHMVMVTIILVLSFIDQVKKKCNDRTAIVKAMFKVEEQLKAGDNTEKEEI